MKKIEDFIEKNYNKILFGFLFIIFFNTCGSGDFKILNKKIEKLTLEVDSLKSITVTKKDLQLEGLKSEKRMIQSTDRKILDVNRQNEIDKQIEILQK